MSERVCIHSIFFIDMLPEILRRLKQILAKVSLINDRLDKLEEK